MEVIYVRLRPVVAAQLSSDRGAETRAESSYPLVSMPLATVHGCGVRLT